MNQKNKFGYIVGQITAAILLSCTALCLSGIAVALTIKFLTWIF